VGDIEASPLEAEGFKVLIGDEAGDVVADWSSDGAVAVDECGAIEAWLQWYTGVWMLQAGVLCCSHDRVCRCALFREGRKIFVVCKVAGKRV